MSKRKTPEEVAKEWLEFDKKLEEEREFFKKCMERYEALKGVR